MAIFHIALLGNGGLYLCFFLSLSIVYGRKAQI